MAQIRGWTIFNVVLILVTGLPAHTVALSVPNGFTKPGNNNLYCTPSQWYDILMFFAINYASHAATVKPRPGQTYMHTARDIVLTLIYPYTGLARALESFARSSYNTTDLSKAARAGALCMVFRNKDWKPSWRTRILARMPKDNPPETSSTHGAGDNVELESEVTDGKISKKRGVGKACREPSSSFIANRIHAHGGWSDQAQDIELQLKQPEAASRIGTSNQAALMQGELESFAQSSRGKVPGSPSWLRSFLDSSNIWTRNIQGECRLPEGYSLAILPTNARLASSSHDDPANVTLSCSHSIPKIVAAIVQAIYASNTVFRAQGDQIDRFGYAAFGFTVLPYMLMSLMNLLGSLLLPDYPTLYIVRSLESDEAILLGGTVDGAVGRLVQRKDDYLNFLLDSSVYEKDEEQDATSIDESNMAANQSMRIGGHQSHVEVDSYDIYDFATSVVASLPSHVPDASHNAEHERYRQNGEERDSAAHDVSPRQNWLRGDNEHITYKSARHVKRLKPNRAEQHASYTQFAIDEDTERWQIGTTNWHKNSIILASFAMTNVFPAIPLAVIGGMTHFHKGHSTRAQRAWIMTWLACNLSLGPLLDWGFDPTHRPSNMSKRGKEVFKWYPILFAIVYAIPAIGGFVTVGQMLWEYGSCTVLDGL